MVHHYNNNTTQAVLRSMNGFFFFLVVIPNLYLYLGFCILFCLVASVKVFSPCFSFVVAVVRYLLPLLTRGIYKSFFQLGRSKKLVVFVCFQFLSHCLCCVFFWTPHLSQNVFHHSFCTPLHTPARGNQSYLSQPCQHGGKGLVFFVRTLFPSTFSSRPRGP